MADAFTLQLSKFADQAKANIDQVVRKFAIDVTTSVVMKSPVATGRFRANWAFSVGTINGATTTQTDKSGAPTIGRIAAQVPEQASGKVLYISNSLPYAQRLEYGWSAYSVRW